MIMIYILIILLIILILFIYSCLKISSICDDIENEKNSK